MRRISFNEGWTVWKDGHETERREISLPYDAMIHEKRDPDMKDGSASGFFHGGKYFYEKRFVGKETDHFVPAEHNRVLVRLGNFDPVVRVLNRFINRHSVFSFAFIEYVINVIYD